MSEEKGNSFLSFLIELPILVITAVILAWIIKMFIVQPFFIPSGSMEPTLYAGDHILVNKFMYYFTKPKTKDVVVFVYPIDDKKDFIKRVIGAGGDEVLVDGGKVFVNGEALDEPYIPEKKDVSNYGPKEIPKGKLFVMGDNRTSSFDSRFWGFVPENKILGKAFFIYWPINRIGFVR
ncbi:MAG: signal peptidase I [Actinobacteria bacterium]|nr:signal peptidase I [Actinomycetota bacterium]